MVTSGQHLYVWLETIAHFIQQKSHTHNPPKQSKRNNAPPPPPRKKKMGRKQNKKQQPHNIACLLTVQRVLFVKVTGLEHLHMYE